MAGMHVLTYAEISFGQKVRIKMEIKDKILREDMEEIAKDPVFAEGFWQSTVFITGATGLLGSQAVWALLYLNRICGSGIKIVAMARSKDKVKKIFGDLSEGSDLTIYYGDINDPISYPGEVDYIIHGASATSSKYFVSHPAETIRTALDGTRHILEFAKQKNITSMVYLSSLEVYGTPHADQIMLGETDYGYLDPMQARSSYSEGKRMAECLCAAYAAEHKVPVKAARLSQTFGAGVDYHDGRVFAEFARCVVEGKDIILHTAGNTVRSYCYTKDAVRAIFYILLRGENQEAYNVTNMDTAVSIKEMAEMACALDPKQTIRVKVEIPEDVSVFGYNPEMVIRLDASKLQKLGWKPTVGLTEMFRRMIESSFGGAGMVSHRSK